MDRASVSSIIGGNSSFMKLNYHLFNASHYEIMFKVLSFVTSLFGRETFINPVLDKI